MIRVVPADEPESFDEKVRQPGLRAIAQRVGEGRNLKGWKGRTLEKVAERREELKSEHFPPYWREALPELLAAYHRICAYSCFYIERVTGGASVDHFAPVSQAWDRVYEWSNYRLACALMNGRKRDFGSVLDPFEVEEGFFALDLVNLKVVPGPRAGPKRKEIEKTIQILGLDGAEYRAALEDYWEAYFELGSSLRHIERRAPFFASELRRQGRLRRGDV